MQYTIQYKVSAIYHDHGGSLCGKSNLFPVLDIRYRKNGSKKWERLGNAEIDLYTYNRFGSTYYKDFKKSRSAITTLETKSDYERLTLFMEILDAEFDGCIRKLAEMVVRDEVIMRKAEDEEREEVDQLTVCLVTDGWNTVCIDI